MPRTVEAVRPDRAREGLLEAALSFVWSAAKLAGAQNRGTDVFLATADCQYLGRTCF